MSTRPQIPRPDARQIRQRCGFGCVMCGLPLYEYDHLDGWANTYSHDPERVTLLCDKHHREKTGGLLPESLVEQANARPSNLQNTVSKPYSLYYGEGVPQVDMGTNICLPDSVDAPVHAL